MAFSYNKKNLANTTITGAITPTQTSVTVADATVFSYAFFYATLMPSNEMSNASNSEIVLVTNIQGNTLTLVRGQENTIARSFPYGAVITNGIYTRDIDYARSIGRKVFMAEDDGTDDTNTSYQIIDPMIKNVPEEGSIITVEFDTPSYGAPTLGVNNGIGGLVQVSGTDIHITDSSGQIDSVEMYGDTQQTTYSGKNLYEGSPSFNNFVGVSGWEDGGTYNGMPVIKRAGAWGGTYRVINVESGNTYTFSAWVKSDEARQAAIYAIGSGATATISPTSKNITTSTSWERVSFTFTCTTSGTIAPRFENTSASTTNYTYIAGYQLEKNSSMTSFEPYVGGTASPNPDYPQEVQTVTGRQVVTISDGGSQSQEYEINLGKNLLHGTWRTVYSSQGYPAPYSGDVTITSSDNNNVAVTTTSVNRGAESDFIWLPKNTTFTVSFTGTLPDRFFITQYDSSKTRVSTLNSSVQTVTTTSATTTQDGYITVAFTNTVATTFSVATIQIEKGSTATTYAPYFTPIELCKIGTYKNYIFKNVPSSSYYSSSLVEGAWYVHKDISKIVIDGSQSVTSYGTAATGKYRYSVPATGAANVSADVVVNVSDKFVGVTRGDTYNNVNGMYQATGLVGFYWDAISTYTTAQVQTWLSTNNVIAYYPLATPTDTQITNAALVAQLNALYNMLPEGVADVVVTGDLPGSLTIKYYQQGTGTFTAPIVGGAEIDGGDNEQVVELDSFLPYRLVYDTNGYWRVLNKGPKVTTGAIADGAVTADKITRNNINYGTTSSDIRIGTFLGKPLWRRVEKFRNIPTGYSVHNWLAGTISNLDSIVAVNGMWVANGSTTYVPINSLPPDAVTTYGIAVRDFTASSWAVVLGTSMSTVNSGYIILDYTKTS